MHFLLIPYAFFSVIFVALFINRDKAVSRSGLFLMAVFASSLILLAIWWRPATGDSWRYLTYFRELRVMSLSDALDYRNGDPLYALLNWSAGFFGKDEVVLFGATLLVYFSVFIVAIKRLVGPLWAVVVLMCYVAYPYFVAYAANGLRQGLALAFLLMAYVGLRQKNRQAWVWLLLAPFWHSGAWIAVVVVMAHQAMCWFVSDGKNRWLLVLVALFVSVMLSITGQNEVLMSQLPDLIKLEQTQEIYFTDAKDYGYRAGFRIDFFLFSMLPLASALILRRRAPTFDYGWSGWWLSLYLGLNVVYHLFSFVPFADRFAAFSWFLLPLVIFLQVRETESRNLLSKFVALVCLVNVAMLQLYTGNFISAPQGW